MRVLKKLLWLIPWLLIKGFVCAQPADSSAFSFKGYLKFLHESDFVNDPDTLITSQLIHNRLNFRYDLSPSVYIRAELRNRLFFGDAVRNVPHFADLLSVRPTLLDLDAVLIDSKDVVLYTEADRLFAAWSSGSWDIRAGRQRINWGTNLVWNPNDIFNAYNYFDFDYEERAGTDAVRVQYSLKDQSVIELAAAPGKEAEQSVYAAMYRMNYGGYDLQFFAGSFHQQPVSGAGWAGNLGNAGFKGELTWFAQQDTLQEQVNISATVDYTPSAGWYVAGSFLYEQHPLPAESNAIILAAPNLLSSKYLMPFQYSFYGMAMREFSPVTTGQLAVIYGTEDHSAIFYPAFTWSPSANTELLLTAQSYFSERDNEWKAGITTAFFRFKWSF